MPDTQEIQDILKKLLPKCLSKRTLSLALSHNMCSFELVKSLLERGNLKPAVTNLKAMNVTNSLKFPVCKVASYLLLKMKGCELQKLPLEFPEMLVNMTSDLGFIFRGEEVTQLLK